MQTMLTKPSKCLLILSKLKKPSWKNCLNWHFFIWFSTIPVIKIIILLFIGILFSGLTPKQKGNSWIKIKSKEFTMGDNFCREQQGGSDWCSDETPHQVKLDDFAIQMYEVTNDDYYKCFKAGNCTPNDLHEFRPRDFSGRNKPVVFVSWIQASDYCKWAGGRLPTEAEWERAAKGERLGGAHFGKKYDEGSPIGVGQLEFNTQGLYDMLGNVYEWTQDWYGPYKKKGVEINPKGPVSGNDKVVRGGAWDSPANFLRISDRVAKEPKFRFSDVGFRCAKSIP